MGPVGSFRDSSGYQFGFYLKICLFQFKTRMGFAFNKPYDYFSQWRAPYSLSQL